MTPASRSDLAPAEVKLGRGGKIEDDVVELAAAIEVGRAGGAQHDAVVAAKADASEGVGTKRETGSGSGLAVLADVEIAEHRSERIGTRRPADVAVGGDRDFEVEADRTGRAQRGGVAIDHPRHREGQMPGLRGAKLAQRRFVVPEHLEDVRQLEPDAGGPRLFVEDSPEQHRRVAMVVLCHQLFGPAEARLGADVGVGVLLERRVDRGDRRRIPLGIGTLGQREHRRRRQVQGSRFRGRRRGRGTRRDGIFGGRPSDRRRNHEREHWQRPQVRPQGPFFATQTPDISWFADVNGST